MNIQVKQIIARRIASARAHLPLHNKSKHILFGIVLILSLFLTASQSVNVHPGAAKVLPLAPPPLVPLQTPEPFPTTQSAIAQTQVPNVTPGASATTTPTAVMPSVTPTTSASSSPTATTSTNASTPDTSSSTSAVAPVGQTGSWNLIFDDEFNGSALDTSKWNTCFFNFHVAGTQDCTHNQDELELYQPQNVTVSNGVLSLTAQKQTVNANGQTYNYTSGMISTGPATDGAQPKFSFQYGFMEIRALMPTGQGLWPAFWTLAADESYPPEIDVFEILGNATTVDNMNYHYPNGSDEGADAGSTWNGPDFSAGWHTFGVDWEPGSLTWYVDGVARFQTTSDVTSKPQYLIANLAVGGSWPGNPDASTPFPSSLQVDYIHVWQKAA